MKGCTDDPMVPVHRVTQWGRESIGRRCALSCLLMLLVPPLLPTQLQVDDTVILDCKLSRLALDC
jgi:hypothetical protein